MLDQLGNPRRVGDVRLPTGHVAQVAGVEQPAPEVVLQDVIDRLPVHAGGLHPDGGHGMGGEPIAQRQQRRRGGAEGLDDLVASAARGGHPHAGHDRILVDIEAGTSLDHGLHRPSLSAVRRSLFSWSLRCVLAATIVDARGSRVRLKHGLAGTKASRRHRTAAGFFMHCGWAARGPSLLKPGAAAGAGRCRGRAPGSHLVGGAPRSRDAPCAATPPRGGGRTGRRYLVPTAAGR